MPVIAALVLALGIAAPPSQSIAGADSLQAVWLFIDHAYLQEADPAGVTNRALDRRRRRGQPAAGAKRIAPSVEADLARRGYPLRVASSLIGAVSVVTAPERLDDLRTLPYVRAIRPVARRGTAPDPHLERVDVPPFATKSMMQQPDPGLATDQLERINALSPIRAGIDGRGVFLGFLDTEYGQFSHRAFETHRSAGRIVGEQNFVGSAQSNRHGLMVASVAAGRDDGYILGPAYRATLVGAVTEYAPTETRDEEDYFVAGLEWLEAQGVDVVNVSLGYTTFDDDPGYTYDDLDGETAITTLAVQRAADLGVVMVVSAGNEACTSPDDCWYYIGTPADARGAIAVGAVTFDTLRASFSSYGPSADGRVKPDVAAPGVRVAVAIGESDYALASGTSFASPLVAGVACQILQVNGDLTPEEVAILLRETAHQASSPDHALGWGVINAGAAVDAAMKLRDYPMPDGVELRPPYPNPATHAVRVEVAVPSGGFTGAVSLFDAAGREVLRVFDGTLSPGPHFFVVDTPSVASGVYFLHVRGAGVSQSSPIVLIR